MASSRFRVRAPFGLATAALALCAASATAQTYPISHGAPFIGRPMTVKLTGVPRDAFCVLFESEVSDSVATPLGVWELDRVSMRNVAHGRADSSGVATLNVNIPLDPQLAEKLRHYQARVHFNDTFSISHAAHLRLIGARAYVVSGGDAGAGVNGQLTIASLVTQESVFQLDLGVSYHSADRSAQPVFDANYSRGALTLGASDVVFFDPLFGDEIARQSTPPLSGRLLTSPAGDRVFALAPGDFAAGVPAAILSFDPRTGAPLASLQLPPARFTGQWISNLERTFAYVVGRDAATGQLFVQRIDLSSFTDTGAIPIGLPTSERVVDFTPGPRSVYLLAKRQEFPWGCYTDGALTQIDEAANGPSTSTVPWDSSVHTLVAAPKVGLLASLTGYCMFPGTGLTLARLGSPSGPSQTIPGLWADSALSARPVQRGVWLQTFTNDWGGDELWFVSHEGHVWNNTPLGSNYPPTIVDIDAFDDPLGERACALVREFRVSNPSYSVRARLYMVDPLAPGVAHVNVGLGPYSLLAVPIP
jgi:hypothetical protein